MGGSETMAAGGVVWHEGVRDADWAALHALLTECYAPMAGRIDPPSSMATTTPADLRDRAASERLLLGTVDGRPVACGFLAVGDVAVEMGKLAVAPDWRARGLLRAMVGTAGDIARDAGLRWIDLHVRVQMIDNRRIYRRLGFSVIAANCHPGFDRPTSLHLRRGA